MLKKTLIDKINKSDWWHVPPTNKNAYQKKGKFLASTYLQAEFYGRPNVQPENVEISNPVFGFSESEILHQLFPNEAKELLSDVLNKKTGNWFKKRIELDAKMYRKAKSLGYDAIVLVCKAGQKSLFNNRKPNSIELNLIYM